MNKILIIPFVLLSAYLSAQKFDNMALTPPMGWNSWNTFKCEGVNERVIRETVDAMVANGMKQVGYQYVVIDDCWQKSRDVNGNIIVDKTKFPSGIKKLIDYVHSKGLKFGIYSDAGTQTCAKRPGSKGFEYKDAQTYASWGVDYLKYDWCHTEGQDAIKSYTKMRDALFSYQRPIVFSICEWGQNKPWEWASSIGHLWRTTLDINFNGLFDGDEWGNLLGWTTILDKQVGLEKYAGPGHWNDPDMLVVGIGNMPKNEARAHFSMWCMLAAPLMLGNDIRTVSDEIKEILTDKELIAINQDRLGKQGFKLIDEGHFEVWQKPLTNNEIAVCFFNRDIHQKNYSVIWNKLNLKDYKGRYAIENITSKAELKGTTEDLLNLVIPSRDVVVFKLTPLRN